MTETRCRAFGDGLRRWARLAVVLVPAAGVVTGLMFRSSILLSLGVLVFAFLTPVLLQRLQPTLHETLGRVLLDTEGVQQLQGEEVIERVRWDQLAGVSIVTTEEGPYVEDLFWLLHAADGTGCVVPHELACEIDLLDKLQKLRRFDNMAAIEACGTTSCRELVCWEGSPGEGLAAGEATIESLPQE